MIEITGATVVRDVISYPSETFVLLESDDPIRISSRDFFAVQRRAHRWPHAFSRYQFSYNTADGLFAVPLASSLTSRMRQQEHQRVAVLRLGQRIEFAGRVYAISEAPNRNIHLDAVGWRRSQ